MYVYIYLLAYASLLKIKSVHTLRVVVLNTSTISKIYIVKDK